VEIHWYRGAALLLVGFFAVATAFASTKALRPDTSPPGANAANGKAIAVRWCASCHLVSPDQIEANADVPSFSAIARKKPGLRKLQASLLAPHPPMPDPGLSRKEMADIIAYIHTLH
jgi:mono/diheme cytochrome c family protein